MVRSCICTALSAAVVTVTSVILNLQAISRLCEDKYKDLSKAAMKRSVSADNLVGIQNSQAVLS